MDFAAFEQLALQVLFETGEPLGAAHLAYLAGISVRRAERFLGRMAEQGSVVPHVGTDGTVEYLFPARRGSRRRREAASPDAATADKELVVFPADLEDVDGGEDGDGGEDDAVAPEFNSATAVLLSVLVPGAGHIYAGRSGAGVAWMATTLAGYACCLLPGLFLHGLCLVSAAHARHSAASSS
jgi:hypothetical protein